VSASRRVPFAGVVTALALLIAGAASAADNPASRSVLLLHEAGGPGPFRGRFDLAFVEAMRSPDSTPINLYEEAIEPESPGEENSRLFLDYLAHKYAERRIDVIVAQGIGTVAFARRNRPLFGNPPIVAIAASGGLFSSGDETTGLQGGHWIDGTIGLGLTLFPDTRSLIVVDGARHSNDALQAEVERQVRTNRPQLELIYLRDRPLGDVQARLAAVPEHTIVLFIKQTMLNADQDVDQRDGLASVVTASRAPVFSQLDDRLGSGIVGGYVWRFEEDARRVARMARAIAEGASVADVPPGRTTFATVLDWRELQRWHVAEARIPADSTILFRPQSFLETYRRYVIGGAVVFTAELALIVGLLVQHARRRRAEEQTRTGELRYLSVVDTQNEMICRFLPDTTLTFVNDAYCRYWNKTPDQLLGTRFVELIPEEGRREVVDRIAALTRGTDSHEHPVLRPDGGIGWQHWINHAILDSDGRLVELQAIGRDTTDRKRAEEAIDRLRERNTAMLRAVPDLMFVILRDGTYVDYHAKDGRQLLAAPETFIGRTVREIMPPPLADTLMAGIDAALRGDDVVVVEYELPLAELRFYEARIVRAGEDRILSMVRDVTEAKRAAQLNRDLAGRLIASQEDERQRLARELHDNLSQRIALLNIEIDAVAQRAASAQNRAALGALSRHIGDIATEVHNLSHGLHPAKLQTLGLVPAVRSLCREFEKTTGVAVEFVHEGALQGIDISVSLCLYRIVQEALNNIAKHSAARGASVRLSRAEGDVCLGIADSGVGFDAENARPEGLGLVSMRERVSYLRGQLVIRATPGSGTRLDVRIPLGDGRDQPAAAPSLFALVDTAITPG
jgi:PAS domain S-box-containing protein